MTPEEWQKVKLIIEEALEIAPEMRQTYLAEACGGDSDLRREVDSLLEFEEENLDLIEEGVFSAVLSRDSATEAAKNLIGSRIGNYELISELGAGGMGTVFLAKRADGAFEQQAALKIIRQGMDSEKILRRFFTERQILASLKHPNIAHLIDGGTTDKGLPYFVIEYVEGETIIDYAARENLDLDERLKLFREVCAAVSFAHSKLIIHRDLKPSNILVNSDGHAKLLDFGIAKLLKSETAAGNSPTATQNFIFTPEYASPEQVRGEKLTTASDVYSLGIILYELLTGFRPYETAGKNIGEIIRAICEIQPERPSAVVGGRWSVVGRRSVDNRNTTSENEGQRAKNDGRNPKSKIRNLKSLKGDLDNIILKALRKEPERRYLSVEQLSEDVRRHLAGLPVLASKDTWNYRAGKFARRHRLGIGATLLILLSLLGGFAATAYQTRIARTEREKAERRFKDVRKIANSLMFEINDQMTKSPIKARELLVERAVEYLDKLAAESGGDAELESELATAYEKIGDVQSEVFKPYSGKTSEALTSHQKALALRKKLFAAEPNAARAIDFANSHLKIGNIFLASGRLAESRENYRATISILESQLASDPGNRALQTRFAGALAKFGQAVVRSGSLGEALKNYERSLKIYQNLAAEAPEVISLRRSTGVVSSYIGFVKLEMGKPSEAVRDYGYWLALEWEINANDENNIQWRNDLSDANVWYGVALSEAGEISQAVRYFEEGVKIQEEVFSADAENLGEESLLADCHLEFGKALVRHGLPRKAIEHLEKALASYRKIWQKDAQNLMTRHRIANAQRFLADALFQTKNEGKALENYRQAHIIFQELTQTDPENVDWRQDLAMSYRRIGEFALKRRDTATALANFETALPIFDKLAANAPENVKRRNDLTAIKANLAELKNIPSSFNP